MGPSAKVALLSPAHGQPLGRPLYTTRPTHTSPFSPHRCTHTHKLLRFSIPQPIPISHYVPSLPPQPIHIPENHTAHHRHFYVAAATAAVVLKGIAATATHTTGCRCIIPSPTKAVTSVWHQGLLRWRRNPMYPPPWPSLYPLSLAT